MTTEERGRVAYAECAVCHSREDPTAPGYASLVGPSLFGVYGATSGKVRGLQLLAGDAGGQSHLE